MAIEIVDFPLKMVNLSIATLNYQRVEAIPNIFPIGGWKNPWKNFLNQPLSQIQVLRSDTHNEMTWQMSRQTLGKDNGKL